MILTNKQDEQIMPRNSWGYFILHVQRDEAKELDFLRSDEIRKARANGKCLKAPRLALRVFGIGSLLVFRSREAASGRRALLVDARRGEDKRQHGADEIFPRSSLHGMSAVI